MRAVLGQVVLVLILNVFTIGAVAAEQFKYYVWIDEEGIVHAEEEAPKGRDYQVRVIEDINANVVPAEDFRPYGDLPAPDGGDSGNTLDDTASAGNPGDEQAAGQNTEPNEQDSPSTKE